MANGAFQSGFDMYSKRNQKQDPKSSGGAGSDGSKKGAGGIAGLIGRTMKSRKAKGGAAGSPTPGGNNFTGLASGVGDTPSYKKGGRVKRTGVAIVHKGEYVIPAKHSRKMSRKRSVIKA